MMTVMPTYTQLLALLDSNGLAKLRQKGFHILSIDQLTASVERNEIFAKIHNFYIKYLAKPHPLLGREGAVCPFVPLALRYKTIHTIVVNNDEFGKAEITILMKSIMKTMENLSSSKEETSFVVFIASKQITGKNVAELQRVMKAEFVSKGLMIGEFFEGNHSPGLHNPHFYPLQSAIPALAVRTMVQEDYPFMIKEEYTSKERTQFVEAYNKKFRKNEFSITNHLVLFAFLIFLALCSLSLLRSSINAE